MVGYDREDLTSGRVHRTDLTPPEWRERDASPDEELKDNRRRSALRKGVFSQGR